MQLSCPVRQQHGNTLFRLEKYFLRQTEPQPGQPTQKDLTPKTWVVLVLRFPLPYCFQVRSRPKFYQRFIIAAVDLENRFILNNFKKRDSMIDLVHKDVMS